MRHYDKAALMRGEARFERKDDDGADISALVKGAMEPFMKAFEEFKKTNDARLSETEKKGAADVLVEEKTKRINEAMDETKKALEAEILAIKRAVALGGRSGDGNDEAPELKEYRTAWLDHMRTGAYEHRKHELQALEKKALSVGSDPEGGFTVLPEIDRNIIEVLKQVSPIRQLAEVRQTGAERVKKLVNQRGTNSGWVGETDPRAATNNSTLSELEFPTMELYAAPTATQSILDDSYLNIEQWIMSEIDTEFAYQEGRAFVLGNGIRQPSGFLSAHPIVTNASYQWGRIGYVPTGAAGAFPSGATQADPLVQLYHSLRSPLRANASWVANNNTLGTLRQLKDGQGNYLIRPTFASDGIVEIMMGKPVTEVVDMPDIGANAFAIAFADWRRAYLIVDRIGTRVLRDPYTAKPYVMFYTTKRVGGGVQNFEAIKLLRFATS